MLRRALLLAAPLLLALACQRPGASREPRLPVFDEDVIRLARSTSKASRLDVDHALFTPRVIVRAPEAVVWEPTNAAQVRGSAFSVRAMDPAAGGFEMTSELPATPGVGYVIRAAIEGDASVALRVQSADGREWSAWESSPSSAQSPVVEASDVADGRRMQIRLRGTGQVVVRELEVREALLREPTQLVSAADYDLRGYIRQTHTARDLRGREVLLAGGASAYEWTWPATPVARVLDFETGVVPRDGAAPAPVTAAVDVWDGKDWHEAYRAVRGVAGDDGQWARGQVDLANARGVRLRTEPVSGGAATAMLAWARPVVRPRRRPERPDVVLITLDALRASDLGAYGSTAGLSPAIDQLAAGAVVFDEARTARGQTWESLTAIAHASRPEAVGVHDRGDRRSRGHDGVAGVFAEAGYLTVRLGNATLPAEQLGEMDIDEDQARDDLAMDRLHEVLATEHERPIFAWVHLSSTHYPYNVSASFLPPGEPLDLPPDVVGQLSNGGPEADLRRISRRSDAAVREDDSLVGKLLPDLARADRPGGPAIVALSADHGSHRGEQGMWFNHSTVSRAVLRVPLVVSWPQHLAPRRVDRLVRLIDLGPTLLDYAQLPCDAFEGRTLRPLVEGGYDPERTNVITWTDIVVVENDRFKVVATTPNKVLRWENAASAHLAIPQLSLFAWRDDPGEAHDLSRDEPLVAGSLLDQATGDAPAAQREVAHDAARLLRQAGYAAHDDP